MKIKHKEQILKVTREKQQITHKGIPIRITADLSIETLQARREWQDILKVMKEKNLQPRLLYPARISFKYEGEIKRYLEGTNSRITDAEDRISEVEYRMVEINEAERTKEKRIKRNEDNLRNLWDNVKHPNI